MSGLTTHILDLAHGIPAANVKLELYGLLEDFEEKRLLKSSFTNYDGRLDTPLLTADEVQAGEYELVFFIGDYFRVKKIALEEPHFLEMVPVRFGISDTSRHYHLPLLVSPWGYQVYRGS